MVVNALGPPPPYVVEQAHERGILVGGLVGNRQHAERQVAQGTDVIVAQGTEAGGHCGDVSTMVLVPEVVDAVGPDVPVLAAGGIGRGRQMAAALALGAQGVWTGSIWLTVAEADTNPIAVENLLAANSRGTVRSRSMTGKPARQLRTAWTDAWERDDTPEPLPMPLQGIVFAEAARRVSRAAEQGADRVPGGTDRRQHEQRPARPRRHLRHGRGVGRDHPAARVPHRRGVSTAAVPDPDLERIHEFTSLVIASTRSSRQRERLQLALGLGVSETNLGVLRLIERHGPIAVTEVARRLEIDLSNASRQVRALEEQGLVDAQRGSRRPARRPRSRSPPPASACSRRCGRSRSNDYAVALEDWSAADRAHLAELLDRFRARCSRRRPTSRGGRSARSAEARLREA